MQKKIIGYIICEAATRPSEPKILKESNDPLRDWVTVEAILQEGNTKNRNIFVVRVFNYN